VKICRAVRMAGECAALLLAIPLAAIAQDRRAVTEPTIPAVCVTLHATLALHNGKLNENDESKLDTARVQHALDTCDLHKAVELAANGGKNVFLIGPISLPAGVTLLVDGSTTLMASRDPRLYDLRPGSCGLVSDEPEGCRAIISVTQAPHSAIMGDGVIDGRGGEKLLNDRITWWDLAEKARTGGRQQVPRLIVADGSDDFVLYRITLRNSPNFHVLYRNGHGFTVWNLKIDTPRTARNTDGVDPASAEDITVTHSFIGTGDDNIAIKGSGQGVGHMTVIDNHFYYGHGMSVGSETFAGVHDVLVKNLSLDGPDNGIRIKSNTLRGGLVDRITYTNVCIRNSKRPIVLDTHYEQSTRRANLYPEFRNIRLENVHVFGGGEINVEGMDSEHRTSLSLNGVTLDDPKLYTLHATQAAIDYGPGRVNFKLTGDGVTNSGTQSTDAEAACSAMFVPFEDSKNHP
jgi:polygalacturonase